MILDAARVFRFLAARPGFGAVVLVTLALGIGAPTAVFSVVHAVLLRPLPYPEADRLVQFRMEARTPRGTIAFDAVPASAAIDWASQSATLAALSLYNDRALTLSTPDGPRRLNGIAATPNLFELLGIPPAIGRPFAAASRDTREVVLSHRTWREYFASSPSIVGTSIVFDGEPYRVTGVMPEWFRFPSAEAAFWVPVLFDAGGSRGMLQPAIARLRPDATLPAVLEEGRRMVAEGGDGRVEHTLLVRSLQDQLVGGVTRVLWILLGAVTVVAIIATTNVALLLLVRGAGRAHEFSIRLALGAGRGQLARQLFIEAAMLALIGGVAGVALAAVLLRVLLRFAPPEIPRLEEVTLNAPVLAFALAVTAVASVVFGMLSAGRTLAIDPVRSLGGADREESRLFSGRSVHRRMNVLAAAELALTMVLLVGAGLLLRSFVALVLVDQGFTSRGALALRVSLPSSRYPGEAARFAFHDRLLERLKQLPNVEAAGLITSMPNRQATGRFDFAANELPPLNPFNTETAEVRMASDGFFEAMGIRLRGGRAFTAADRPGAEPVVILSEQLARKYFPDRDAVGQVLYSHAAGTVRVVGVAANVRPAAGGDPSPSVYLPLRQNSGSLQWQSAMNVIVRGRNPAAIATDVRTLVLSLDPEVPTYTVRTLDEEVSSLVAGPRFVAMVLGAFAGAALVLAAIGVYGVMAWSTGQRTREIGVRVALGATRAQVLGLMMRDGLVVVAAGLGVGLLLAIGVSRTLIGLLYEVQSMDPVALISTAALLAIAGLTAAYLPARRATRINPTEALRN
jgi:predicted permease